MKKIIKFLLIITLITFIQSCSEDKTVKNNGLVLTKNGYGDLDTLEMECIGCKENLSVEIFDEVITEFTNQAKESLNNPLSFVPRKINIIVKKENKRWFENGYKIDSLLSVVAIYTYLGKNSYGTEMETTLAKQLYIHNNKIEDLEDQIKLEDLKLENGLFISRKLELYSDDKWVEVTPLFSSGQVGFHTLSSIKCIDNVLFTIVLWNGVSSEFVSMYSINDFNCDGESFYRYIENLEKLKMYKATQICITSDDEQILVDIPNNQSDYFQQMAKLINKVK
jgi:hypothetical protein